MALIAKKNAATAVTAIFINVSTGITALTAIREFVERVVEVYFGIFPVRYWSRYGIFPYRH